MPTPYSDMQRRKSRNTLPREREDAKSGGALERHNVARRLADMRVTTCVSCAEEFERHAGDRRQWCSPKCMPP